jgi:hypothetical protein
LAVAAAQEDHYCTRHKFWSEVKVRQNQRCLEVGESKYEVEGTIGVLCGFEISRGWSVDRGYLVIAAQSRAKGSAFA